MRTRIVILLASLTSLVTFSASVNIECSYESDSWTSLSSIYKCYVENDLEIVSREAAMIDSTNGTHECGRNNSDVTAFYVKEKGSVSFFPRGLDEVFPNLKGIAVVFVKLKEVHQSDLKPFVDLLRLDLYGNELTFLEAGLFDFNRNLEFVSFESNKLVHIDHFVFEELQKLCYLHFFKNPCLNKNVKNDSTAVIDLVNELNTKCKSPDVVPILGELDFLEDPKLTIRLENYPSFERRLEKLEESFKNSKISSHEQVKKRLIKLSQSKFRELLSQSSDPSQSTSNEMLDKIQAIENVLTAKMTALDEKLSIRRDMQSELVATVTDFASKMTALNEKLLNVTIVNEKY